MISLQYRKPGRHPQESGHFPECHSPGPGNRDLGTYHELSKKCQRTPAPEHEQHWQDTRNTISEYLTGEFFPINASEKGELQRSFCQDFFSFSGQNQRN
jgi:hypothetical protein